MFIGPILRCRYMDVHVPRVFTQRRLLLIGIVEKAGFEPLYPKRSVQ